MFYFLGSILFALAMMAAFAVMADNFARYRRAMMTALRSLSLDGFGETPRGFTLPAALKAGALTAAPLPTGPRRAAA